MPSPDRREPVGEAEAAPGNVTRLVARRADRGERLDRFLAACVGLSRRRCRELVADGEVWLNGRPVRVQSRPVEPGDVVDVLREPAGLGSLTRPPLPRPGLLYLDRSLLVADKPAGWLSQPAEDTPPDETTLDEAVLLRLAGETGRRPFLRLVHRIDRLTSGAVLFARTPQVLPVLAGAWRTGAVERRYLAVVEGVPGWRETTLEHPISRDPGHRWRFRVGDGGRSATTVVRVVAELESGRCAVECRLVTGRTHQVRVHLAAAGHPVLGDRLYGASGSDDAGRPLLHAVSLTLPHPATGDRLEVTSPLPADIRALWPEDAT